MAVARAVGIDRPQMDAGVQRMSDGPPKDWIRRNLQSISAFITKGSTPTTHGFAWRDDGITFLRSECVAENGLDLGQASYIDEDAHEKLRRGEVSGGDILMTITGYVGRVVRLAVDFGVANTNQHIARIRINAPDVDPEFVFQFLRQSNVRRNFDSITTGQAYPQLSLVQVRETKVPLPALAEQRAIATALRDADSLIQNLDQHIAKKRAMLKGAMQELLAGKRRLPGYTEKWDEHALGDMLTFLNHASKPRADLSDDGTLHYLHYGDIHAHPTPSLDAIATILPTIDPSKVPNIQRLEVGDLVIADASEDLEGTGKSVEIVRIPPGGLVAGLHTIAARGKPGAWAAGFNAYLQFMRQFKAALERVASGLSVYAISKKQIGEISLPLPRPDEQRAIIEVLGQMHEEISVLGDRREKIATLKQGMMQNLLTGKMRLPTEGSA